MKTTLHYSSRALWLVAALGSVVAIALTGRNLFAQQTFCPDDSTQPTVPGCSNPVSVSMVPKAFNKLPAGLQMVTIQELRHVVPKDAQEEMKKAEKAGARNRKEEAIDHFNSAIRLDPEFVAARNNLAALYLRDYNPEPAIAQLEETVKIDPHNPVVFTNLVIGYIMTERFDAAERAARATVDLDRTDGLPRYLLGVALVYQRKFTEEALQCFELSSDERPLAHLLAGRVLIARNNLQAAKSEIRTYLSSKEQTHRVTANQWLDIIERNEQQRPAVSPQ